MRRLERPKYITLPVLVIVSAKLKKKHNPYLKEEYNESKS
jgi:hypothetical protein